MLTFQNSLVVCKRVRDKMLEVHFKKIKQIFCEQKATCILLFLLDTCGLCVCMCIEPPTELKKLINSKQIQNLRTQFFKIVEICSILWLYRLQGNKSGHTV